MDRRLIPCIFTVLLLSASAGCIQAGPEASPSLAYGPGFHTTPDRNVTLEALEVPDPVRTGSKQTWHLEVSHSAASGEAFDYASTCQSPWVVRLGDAYGQALHWREQDDACFAAGEKVLEPGESQTLGWTWSGRHHPDGGNSSQPLEPGTYVLTFRFVDKGGDGPTAHHVFEID